MILKSSSVEADLYDDRYRADYMLEWPVWKKRRIVKLITETLTKPDATVLDFGCGRALFAAALKNAQPSWQISGFEISDVAVSQNREAHRDMRFYDSSDPPDGFYDLVYTHHVLEHVADLQSVVRQTASLVDAGGLVLHVLPCGNAGSFEARMARLVKNGVDQKAGRFYYEEPGHLRRLTSAELIAICNENQLRLKQQLFANQFWGGIEFLTEHRPEVLLTWLDPRRGTGSGSGLILGILATGLIAIALGRLPARIVSAVRRRRRSPSFYVLLPLALALWPLSAPIDHAIRWSRQWEWHRRADDPDGSEMYLIFERL